MPRPLRRTVSPWQEPRCGVRSADLWGTQDKIDTSTCPTSISSRGSLLSGASSAPEQERIS